jgi:hypothetical protein
MGVGPQAFNVRYPVAAPATPSVPEVDLPAMDSWSISAVTHDNEGDGFTSSEQRKE